MTLPKRNLSYPCPSAHFQPKFVRPFLIPWPKVLPPPELELGSFAAGTGTRIGTPDWRAHFPGTPSCSADSGPGIVIRLELHREVKRKGMFQCLVARAEGQVIIWWWHGMHREALHLPFSLAEVGDFSLSTQTFPCFPQAFWLRAKPTKAAGQF